MKLWSEQTCLVILPLLHKQVFPSLTAFYPQKLIKFKDPSLTTEITFAPFMENRLTKCQNRVRNRTYTYLSWMIDAFTFLSFSTASLLTHE
jgi:hypothetical protein